MSEAVIPHMVYQPARDLGARIARRLTPLQARRSLSIKLERPLVSFTFDDCPHSAFKYGVPVLEAQNWRSSLYICCSLFGQSNHFGLHMSADDTKAAHHNGHEVGNHTYHHFDATSLSLPDFKRDIEKNQESLNAIGLPQCSTFAYPYGETYPALKTYIGQNFKGARGIKPVAHHRQADLNQIGSYSLFSDTTHSSHSHSRLLNALDHLKRQPAWITIFTHDISDRPTPWGCTPTNFKSIVDKLIEIEAQVLPVSEAIDFMEARL